MAINIRSDRELESMRAAGAVVGNVLHWIEQVVVPGMTTAELTEQADRMIAEAGGIALFKGVPNPQAGYPFPACLCTSINDVVVHGIPNHRELSDGDVLSVDCGVKLNGYCGDAATTVTVGQAAPRVQELVETTREVLGIAVDRMKPGVYWSEIAAAMQQHAESRGFGVVREYVGHGIGRRMHEDPKVPNYVSSELKRRDLQLRKGMVLAVEPMITLGTYRTRVMSDGWAVVTTDGKPAAHFEHTIAVTEQGARVLTANASDS